MAQMKIPAEELSQDVLDKIIEDFVLQEGTDYGSEEYSLEQKVTHVRAQLRSGKAILLYDEETEVCGIFPAKQEKF